MATRRGRNREEEKQLILQAEILIVKRFNSFKGAIDDMVNELDVQTGRVYLKEEVLRTVVHLALKAVVTDFVNDNFKPEGL